MKLSIKNMAADWRGAPALIVIFTAVFRTLLLAIKPPHFDEGVNGWFVDEMTRTGYFTYDPGNYHGPLHFYILFLFKAVFGRNLWALRMPIVILSTLTVWLVTKFDRFIDRRACWLAALAMAVSPGMEFYGRYAIHETELVLFLILSVWGGAGIWRFGGRQYLWAAALGVTGMILTKETYIIHLTAFAMAGMCLWILEKILPSREPFPRQANAPPWPARDLCVVGAACVGLIIFFYSGTFLDFSILKGLYQTFELWAKTGQAGNGHEKVWYYWFKLTWHYEWPVIAGMVLSLCYIWPRSNPFIRYLMIYGWGTFTAYSIVHYKTPWCIISIIWPFYFVLGHFLAWLMDVKNGKIPVIIATALLLAASFAWSVRLSFYHYTDDNEDYVYVQTFNDINNLTGPLFKLVAQDPVNYHLKGHIIMGSSHPLPWLLGDFTNIGYYDDDPKLPPPEDMDAAFLLVDIDREEEVQKSLKENYFTGKFHLRSSMDPVTLYLNYNKFHELFPGRKPEFIQGVPAPADTGDPEDTP